MGRQILVGNPPIAVNVRQSKRARRLSLRVSHLDGSVSLTTPPLANAGQIETFLSEKESWLRKHVQAVPEIESPQIGRSLLFRGQGLPVVGGDVRRAKLANGQLVVPEEGSRTGPLLKAFLKLQARDALAAASDDFAAQLGRQYTSLSLRDTRSRWGSCTHKGGLMYSWRLIMAPPEVLSYVAAHEVAHLQEMNHSPAFWQVVADLMPDFQTHRTWLKTQGSTLHRISFEN